ncbi:MAG TPA: SsrA-binding protein [Candidatus Moranbacteria bacterium]|nr:MAG: SsrA-binding protein [Candidatus Moranbacteria bacterium GW2011_GWC2_45_10]KKT95097.1 MAG: SsrA-binding protein, SsrA-binding protein [Parcubacteria group bacterium GW2011_GWC1_45_14]HAV11272.1 SsrA-binding protein [Candidatus Moranbacteria bacterium]
MATIAINKRATFDYEILEKYEAGLMLTGAEVKSIKTGRISLKESFVTIKGSELYLTNANIPKYSFAGELQSYEPTRPRKLLVRKSEIKSLIGKARTQGLTLIPLRVYTKKRLIKLEFALAQGKKAFDKRSDIAKRDAKRKIERALKKR